MVIATTIATIIATDLEHLSGVLRNDGGRINGNHLCEFFGEIAGVLVIFYHRFERRWYCFVRKFIPVQTLKKNKQNITIASDIRPLLPISVKKKTTDV